MLVRCGLGERHSNNPFSIQLVDERLLACRT